MADALIRFFPTVTVPGRRAIVWVLLSLVVAGCTSLPPQAPRPVVTGISDWSQTELGGLANQALAGQDSNVSGFRLLQSPAQALDARLSLIGAAQRSLDLQYHQFQNDRSGSAIMVALGQAGARGVRVRVLVDDLLTAGEDDVLLGLASLPNVEVRLFNPFAAPRGANWTRYLGSLGNLNRLGRRMHNKLFVVDNALAISGGRNLADDYLLAPEGANMIEIDVLSAGPVVRVLTQNFDRYWNSRVSYPIEALTVARQGAAATLEAFQRATSDKPLPPAPTPSPNAAPMLSSELAARRLQLVFGTATAYADPPEKVLGKLAESTTPVAATSTTPAPATSVPVTGSPGAGVTVASTVHRPSPGGGRASGNVVAALYDTRSEILIATPYLIPGAAGIVAMRQTLEKNRKVMVVTNSLASTDEPMVHQAYALYRDDLLKAGARIYELSPSRSGGNARNGSPGDLSAPGRLQSRITIVDRSRVYFGSMNLDGRSARANTELGLIIDSPALASQLLTLFAVDRREGIYEVRLAPDSRNLEWVTWKDGAPVVYSREPETSWYERTRLWLSSPFISSDLL